MVSWENQQSIHFFDGKVNLRFRKAAERDFIYASNEPKSVLARDLGDCRDNLRNSRSVFLIVMGFILLRVLEFFVFRKMEMPETKNHLLCGWRQSVVQKNHLSVTIELFRHYCKKGKVILWRIRIMI